MHFKRGCPEGVEIIAARSGPEGVAEANNHPDLSLIFCDYNMPGMDGLETCRSIRKLENHRATVIVMCSTESDKSLREKGRDIGVRHWIIKPVSLEKVASIIEKLAVKS